MALYKPRSQAAHASHPAPVHAHVSHPAPVHAHASHPPPTPRVVFKVSNPAFHSKFSSPLWLEAWVGDNHFPWLVDTGADISVIDYQTCVAWGLRGFLRAADFGFVVGCGGENKILGTVRTKVRLRGVALTVNFSVVEQPISWDHHGIVLMGRDVLDSCQAVIDVKNRIVTMSKISVRCLSGEEKSRKFH